MINRPPKVMRLAIDLHEIIIQVPLPIRVSAHLLNALPADFSSEHPAKPIPPEPNGFVADINAAFVQKILNIPKRRRETDIELHRQPDDLGASFEVAKWRTFGHEQKLDRRPARLKPVSPDGTRG